LGFKKTAMIPSNLTREQLINDMKACEQTKGMNVLEHGDMVRDYYHDLYFHLYEDTKLRFEWKLPNWLLENKDMVINKLCNDYIMQDYMILHDCGKPYCRTVDQEGKHHFTDHANVSYEVYSKLYPENRIVGELIKKDMVVHCLKGENVEEFSRDPLAISLLISALCEIHANASMFGGIESTSFKIKWKQIDRRGRQIFEKILSK
jgi:hypothetical protein